MLWSFTSTYFGDTLQQYRLANETPYKGTGKYQKDIDHDKFLEWVKNSPYKIYVSSYEFDLPCVFELSHRSSLSATNNSKKVVEKLFCNQEELTKGSLF